MAVGEAPADPEERRWLECASSDCRYLVHSRVELGGYCCQECFDRLAVHGQRCERKHAPENADKAHASWVPMSEKALAALDSLDGFDQIEPEDRVRMVEDAKEEGNQLLKVGCFEEAEARYEEGVELSFPVVQSAADPPQGFEGDLLGEIVVLYVALRVNLAQACLKLKKWPSVAEHTSMVLDAIDPDHAKALFRRAVACLHMEDEDGRLEQARADFTRVAQLDPANREARQHLQSVKQLLQKKRQQERLAFGGVAGFLKGGSLYEAEHAALDKLREEYEEAARSELLAPGIACFEDWLTKKREKAQEKKDGADGAATMRESEYRQEEEDQLPRFQAQAAVAMGPDEEVELDEEELKILREAKNKGYYHGRLNTVLSNQAPTPEKLACKPECAQDMAAPSRSSEWNRGGTWEERDLTKWAKERLSERLASAKVVEPSVAFSGGTTSMTAEVTEVHSIEGDAQIIMVRNRPRYSCNFDAVLSFRLSVGGERFDGTLALPDLSSTIEPQDLQIVTTWTGAPPQHSGQWLDSFHNDIRSKFASFVKDYQQK